MVGSATPDPQDGDLTRLLRQLSIGVALWRLYPADPRRPATAQAVALIRAAAGAALAGRSVRVRVEATGLVVEGRHLGDDPHLQRLAGICFERRIERIELRAVPSDAEVHAAFDVLTTPSAELDEAGGAQAVLTGRGVTSVRLGTGAEETPGRGAPGGDVAGSESARGGFLVDHDLPATSAAMELYQQLASAAGGLSDEETGRSGVYAQAARVVRALDPDRRAEFGKLVRARALTDAFAERYLVQLTDLEVAHLAVDVAAHEDADPLVVADALTELVGRRPEVVQLVAEAVARAPAHAPAATTAAIAVAALTDPSLLGAAGGPTARLVRSAADQASALRDAYPADAAAMSRTALDAWVDYAAAESDVARLTATVASLEARLRAALEAFDGTTVGLVAGVLDEAAGRNPAVGAARRRGGAVDAALVRDLLEKTGPDVCAATLAPLAAEAVEAVIDALGSEERPATRRALGHVLVALGADHVDVIRRRLRDERWFLVRNLVAALGEIGTDAASTAIVDVAGHPHPRVRTEAARALGAGGAASRVGALEARAMAADPPTAQLIVLALAGIPGDAAAAAVRRLVPQLRDLSAVQQCIDALAERGDGRTPGLLAALGARDSGLPWRARARARRHARRLRARRTAAGAP